MAFLGVYTAVYDYQPQAEGELEIKEGDLLFILEKNTEDDWWKAKKKAEREDEDEPEGLVPNNYVEEAQPIHKAKALYDYTRQTDEEVSFSEDADLVVYDTSDPDWTLVGVNDEYGFAPSNYIEIKEDSRPQAAPAARAAPAIPPAPAEPPAPALPRRPEVEPEVSAPPTPSSPISAIQGPAAAIAGILHRQHGSVSSADAPREAPPPPQPPRPVYVPEETVEADEPSPALPQRPKSQHTSPPERRYEPSEPSPTARTHHSIVREREQEGGIHESPPFNRVGNPTPRSPSGYHIYNVNEMVEVMGKRKKMPTTLGINVATGTIFISPDYDDGDHQEWTAEKLTHYSIEGKHVFMDLVRPSKSVDFHAGAKDTAREIVAALGEIAGGYRAEGLKEVIAAGSGGPAQKKGQVLYDFMAQGDDEVTVSVGDEVIILDDTKSDEWWMVRRIKNGKEGVVPSSYIEITGFVSAPTASTSGVNAGLSTIEQNRLEEARLAKDAAHKSNDSRGSERKRDSRADRGSISSKPKPDPSKTRSWTDRTGSFTVEAQFLALQDGKIHLHKQNGVKIAVPVSKMSVEDLEYVEKVTGQSLDEDKPLSDIRRRSLQVKDSGRAGASVNQHDWFDFFLKAGVGHHQCERYSQNFNKDSIDESVLPDITPETLRTLGLKEGDILRVMRYLDNMFNRTGAKSKLRNVSFGGEEVIDDGQGGLFSGAGGALRNNTRKGRPTPAVQAGDVVDPKAFEQKDAPTPAESQQATPANDETVKKGFDDDAWEVKAPKQAATSTPAVTTAAATAPIPSPASPAKPQAPQQQASLTGAMADLSLLQAPLQPTPAQPTQPTLTQPPLQPQPTVVQPPPPIQQPQPTGANPSFFAQLGQPGQQPSQGLAPQITGFQQMPPRQRPLPPQTVGQNSLLPPPPPRPLSAPQNFQAQSGFGLPPLQPQLTGIPQNAPHIAPAGQSLNELNQQRFQQQLQPQPTGFVPQGQFQNGLMPQPTGFGQSPSQFGFPQQPQPQYMNIQPAGSPFADPRPPLPNLAPQPTGFGGFPQQQQPMPTGINSVLPPALQPQPTGMNGFGNTTFTPPPVPPIPQQPTAAPLRPQKTGPPPPVRFGVKHEAKKLTPQPTGLRANLAQATPSNPFGF